MCEVARTQLRKLDMLTGQELLPNAPLHATRVVSPARNVVVELVRRLARLLLARPSLMQPPQQRLQVRSQDDRIAAELDSRLAIEMRSAAGSLSQAHRRGADHQAKPACCVFDPAYPQKRHHAPPKAKDLVVGIGYRRCRRYVLPINPSVLEAQFQLGLRGLIAQQPFAPVQASVKARETNFARRPSWTVRRVLVFVDAEISNLLS